MILKSILQNKKLISNFSYLTILEVFILIAPLITYPYLVKVLGRDLYGWVITAQVTASYCSVLVDFGFKRISARHIAKNVDNPLKIGEVISTILILRSILWIIGFLVYLIVIWIITSYREHLTLFLFSFITTLSSVVFLDFYFQGIENMKYITIVNIIVRGIFVAATFFVIKNPSDYIYVPLLWGIGYILGGLISNLVVFYFHRIKFIRPTKQILKKHLKEGSLIFTSDVMLTIKDKLNYNLLGAMVGISDIVVYDVGSKISSLLQKPVGILCTALYPQMSKNPTVNKAKKSLQFIVILSVFLIALINIFLPWIVKYFIDEDIDLSAIRLFTLAPLIVGVSMFISSNVFLAFGKDNLILKSTIITTIGYLSVLGIMYYTGHLDSVMGFVILTISAYVIEAVYRLIMSHKIFINKI